MQKLSCDGHFRVVSFYTLTSCRSLLPCVKTFVANIAKSAYNENLVSTDKHMVPAD